MNDLFRIDLAYFDWVFFVRLGLNLIAMVILIRFIYYRVYRRTDYFFTFFMFNLTIFIITYLLNADSTFTIGAAFGLFAIFSMLRYRTEDISPRDMTYLFSAITLGLISAVNTSGFLGIAAVNSVILLAAWLLEGGFLLKTAFVKNINYEKIELIAPNRRAELIADLEQRTGLKIHRVQVKRIDFTRDTATIAVHYHSEGNQEV